MQMAPRSPPRMIDFRLYRLAFLPALVAVIAVMFSLEGAPDPFEPAGPPGTFDGGTASAAARLIATKMPDRQPGSAGDSAAADLVSRRFDAVPAGAVSEQQYGAEYDGHDVTLRNVVLTLPGDGSSTIVVAAARDASRAPAAASSAAATGVLVELARALGERQHERTFVLASVSGSATGATGMRELIKAIPDPDTIEAVIVISQPGSASPRPPYVVGSSSGQRSAPVQLELTAERAVETQTGRSSTDESAFTQLARLAIPSGLGDQAPLIGEGVDAIAVSSAGERTLPADDDQLDDVDPRTIDEFGRAIQTMIGALDVAVSDPVHGPSAHIEIGRNLVPGWALAALALTLILPAAVSAFDACARSMRERLGIRAGLAWGAACSLPFVGGLAMLYALVVVGLVPRPPFPFDPALYSPGARGAVTLALVLVAAGASVAALRFRRRRPAGAPPAGGPALGAISSAACFALWLANPYMALLLAPAAHAWLLTAGAPGAVGRSVRALVALITLVPAFAAVAAVATALELGGDAPWTLTLMVADGQVGLGVTLPLCFIAGGVAGTVALLVRMRTLPAPA
jgi:Peptidase family M28